MFFEKSKGQPLLSAIALQFETLAHHTGLLSASGGGSPFLFSPAIA